MKNKVKELYLKMYGDGEKYDGKPIEEWLYYLMNELLKDDLIIYMINRAGVYKLARQDFIANYIDNINDILRVINNFSINNWYSMDRYGIPKDIDIHDQIKMHNCYYIFLMMKIYLSYKGIYLDTSIVQDSIIVQMNMLINSYDCLYALEKNGMSVNIVWDIIKQVYEKIEKTLLILMTDALEADGIIEITKDGEVKFIN